MKKVEYDGERIESGPLQVGDDWPGTFIRGDNSFYYGTVLTGVIKRLENIGDSDMGTKMDIDAIRSLHYLLSECIQIPDKENEE